jgi:hypothetical protein
LNWLAAPRGTHEDRLIQYAVNEIVRGSQPLDSVDGLVKTRASGGGDRIRADSVQALSSAS